jgi:predicted TIM-barrel fold metal-dependent hydrolase
MEAEIERAFRMGLRGVKIHSDMQKVALDDPRLFRLYEIIEGRAPLLAHTGDRRFDYSNPVRLLRVLDAFPRLTVIGAHLGGWSVWPEAVGALKGRDVLVDCSTALLRAAAGAVPGDHPRLRRGAGALWQRLSHVGPGRRA